MNIFNSLRFFFVDMMYQFSGVPIKDLVNADLARNMKWDSRYETYKDKPLKLLRIMMLKNDKSFRSVYYFRMKHHPLLVKLSNLLLKAPDTIEFGNGGIGGGLIISHHHAVIFPKETGKNFRVGPGVVIGRNGDFPRFGDNVYVAANATVVGDIYIGDNTIIGAGSVVTKDIPGNCVVVGNPARIIKNIDNDSVLLNEIM